MFSFCLCCTITYFIIKYLNSIAKSWLFFAITDSQYFFFYIISGRILWLFYKRWLQRRTLVLLHNSCIWQEKHSRATNPTWLGWYRSLLSPLEERERHLVQSTSTIFGFCSKLSRSLSVWTRPPVYTDRFVRWKVLSEG